ncbi:MAG: hypothetical protein U1V55_25090 [Planktothrix rubescens PR222]
MSLETYLVDIQDISSSQLRSNFSEKDLKNMAELILELGGLLKPLIIKEGGLRRFEVIEGHFEYYAVVKALEIDDDLEMVRAFIINENSESSAKKQLQFLNASEPINLIPSIANNEWEAKTLSMESRQNNLEIRLDELIEHQKQDSKRLTDTLQEVKNGLQQLENTVNNLTTNLDELTQLVKQIIIILPPPPPTPTPPPPPPKKLNLQNANPQEIRQKLENVGVKDLYIEAALNAIDHWQKVEGGLTWTNLKKSIKSDTDKIPNFGESTYKKLKQIGEISNK